MNFVWAQCIDVHSFRLQLWFLAPWTERLVARGKQSHIWQRLPAYVVCRPCAVRLQALVVRIATDCSFTPSEGPSMERIGSDDAYVTPPIPILPPGLARQRDEGVAALRSICLRVTFTRARARATRARAREQGDTPRAQCQAKQRCTTAPRNTMELTGHGCDLHLSAASLS